MGAENCQGPWVGRMRSAKANLEAEHEFCKTLKKNVQRARENNQEKEEVETHIWDLVVVAAVVVHMGRLMFNLTISSVKKKMNKQGRW